MEHFGGHGVGRPGGPSLHTGDRIVRFRLSRVRCTRDLPVSCTAVWDWNARTITVSLDVPSGHLEGSWDIRRIGGRALLTGRL